MKKVTLIIIAILLSIQSFGQLNNISRIDSLNLKLNDIELRMDNHYKQVTTGTGFIVFGGIVLVADYFILNSTNNNAQKDPLVSKVTNVLGLTGASLVTVGASFVTAGYIIKLNSHKQQKKVYANF